MVVFVTRTLSAVHFHLADTLSGVPDVCLHEFERVVHVWLHVSPLHGAAIQGRGTRRARAKTRAKVSATARDWAQARAALQLAIVRAKSS